MANKRRVSLDRRKATRLPRQKFIIFCEGANTEPSYFRAVGHLFRDALIEIETEGAAGVPMTIAQSAIRRQQQLGLGLRSRKRLNSFEQKDEVWVVFDRDEHVRFQEAVNLCLGSGIGVGRSDPCFEVWLILHFQEFDKPQDRHGVQRHLESICPEYSKTKGKTPDCAKLVSSLYEAEKRAEQQLKRRRDEGAEFGTPSTTVFELTKAIGKAVAKAKRIERSPAA